MLSLRQLDRSIEARKTEIAAGPSGSGPVLLGELTSTSTPERIKDSASTTADGTPATPEPFPKRPSPDGTDSSLHERPPPGARAQALFVASSEHDQNASIAHERSNGADATSVASCGQEQSTWTVHEGENGAEATSVAPSRQEQNASTAYERINSADATFVAPSGRKQKVSTVDERGNAAKAPYIAPSERVQNTLTAVQKVKGADARSLAPYGQDEEASTVDEGVKAPSVPPSDRKQKASTVEEREPGAHAPSVFSSGQDQKDSTVNQGKNGANAPSVAPSGQRQDISKSGEGERGANTPNVNAKDESRVPKPSSGSSPDAGTGSRRKSLSKRDFSPLPRVSKTPKRGQTDAPGPAHSVEQYLANTGKGVDAIASIRPGTGRLLTFRARNYPMFCLSPAPPWI